MAKDNEAGRGLSVGQVDRRKFRRVQAPVLCSPRGGWFAKERQVTDLSSGGVRVFSDEAHEIGARMDLELLLPSGESVALQAQVAWIEPIEGGEPAAYDLGLAFTDVPADAAKKLATVLLPEGVG
jgi:hypothetical protein